MHAAPQKCSNKPGHLISEEIYIFLLSGNEQILINVETAISDLAARFFVLILFAPHNTGNENLGLSPRRCICTSSAHTLAFPARSLSGKQKTLVGQGLRNSKASNFPARLGFQGRHEGSGLPGVGREAGWGRRTSGEGWEYGSTVTSVLLKQPDALLG